MKKALYSIIIACALAMLCLNVCFAAEVHPVISAIGGTVGDTITVQGIVGQYNGNPQMKNAELIDLVAGSGNQGGGDDDEDDNQGGNTGSGTASTATSFSPDTFTANSSYSTAYTSTDGWSTVNCAIVNTSIQESYVLPGTAVVLRGRKDQQGVLTSCLYANGIKSLSFKYGYGYSETKGFELAIRIKNSAGQVVAQTTLESENLTKGQTYTYTWNLDTAVSGDFTIEFANLGTDSSNKHRVSVWDISWVNNK